MKLIFKTPYLSISQFNDFNINDFSVLTGLNGSGKTQFLNAIEKGHIEVHGIDFSQIKYYSYNDFIVDSKKYSDINDRNRALHYNKNSNYIESINRLKIQIVNEHRKSENGILNQVFCSYLTGIFKFEEYFSNVSDFASVNFLQSELLDISCLPKYRNHFTENFYNFLNSFMSIQNYNLNEFNYLNVKTTYENLVEIILNEFKKRNPEFFDFLVKNTNNKNILNLTAYDFENPNLSLVEIQDLQKDYEIEAFKYITSAIQNQETVNFSDVNRISRFGNSPIEKINQVLEEYDCNGYYLTTNNFKLEFGIDKSKIELPIHLINKETGLITDFNLLSSGEKTLIALCFLVYKLRRDKVMPRVLLLDEIDSSLHPSMINRLLNVFQKIFIEKNNIKIILATHSPTTIALAPEESIYVIHKDEKNKLTKETKTNALNILTEGYATLDEGLKLFDQISNKKICVFSEGNNIRYLEKANTFFGNMAIQFMKGIEGNSGKDQLKSLFNLFSKFPHTSKVFFVWDCDVPYKLSPGNNTYPYTLVLNTGSKGEKGIENLFDASLFNEQHYDIVGIEFGGEKKVFNKNKFEKDILERGTENDFILFKPLFEFIKLNSGLV